MTKDYEKPFQERVDELLLLEQRADRRAEKFLELTNDYQEKSQGALNGLLGKVGGIDESLAKIKAASDSINKYVTLCDKHAIRTLRLFMFTVIAAVFIVFGTLWWSHHINSDLVDAKAELASLNVKLQHTPQILHFHDKDYVRVVEDSETSFRRHDGSEVPGRYAEVWHVR